MEDIFKIYEFDEIYNKVNDKINELSNKVNTNEIEISHLNSKIELLQKEEIKYENIIETSEIENKNRIKEFNEKIRNIKKNITSKKNLLLEK